MSLPHPPNFESLRDVLKFAGISPTALVEVLREYLGAPKHAYADVEIENDHWVWEFRETILNFCAIIDEPKPQNQTTGSDGDDAEDAPESQPRQAKRGRGGSSRIKSAEIDALFDRLLDPNSF